MYFSGLIFILQPFRFILKCFWAIPTPRRVIPATQICSFAKQTTVHFLLKITAMQIQPVFVCKVKENIDTQTKCCLSLQVNGWPWKASSGVCRSLVCPAHVPEVLWAFRPLPTWQTEPGTLSWCGRVTRWGFSNSSTGTRAHRTRYGHSHMSRSNGTELWNITLAAPSPSPSLFCSSTSRLWRSTASRLSVSLSLAATRKMDMRQFAEPIGGSMKKRRGTWRL